MEETQRVYEALRAEGRDASFVRWAAGTSTAWSALERRRDPEVDVFLRTRLALDSTQRVFGEAHSLSCVRPYLSAAVVRWLVARLAGHGERSLAPETIAPPERVAGSDGSVE